MTHLLAGEFTIVKVYLWTLIIVAIVVALLSAGSSIAKWILTIRYHKYNKIQTQLGYTAKNAARTLLDANGMQDVKVEKMGFFKAFFFGNHYSVKHKTIFLRKNIIDSQSITAVGVAIQKVGLATMDKRGDSRLKARAVLLPLSLFAPVTFVPLVSLGLIFDFTLSKSFTGLGTFIASLIGIALYIIAFVYMLINLKIEKQANGFAMEVMEKSGILNEQEREQVKELFKSYIATYVIDFILSIVELIYQILKLIGKFLGKMNIKKK